MRTQHTASMTPAGARRAATSRRGLARAARRVGAVIREMNYAACRVAEPRVTGR